jgi:hypothetical protein
MATSGMDPAFGQTISALASGVSGLPESYAAGQKHLLQQQIALFNQNDKDRNYNLKKPLTEAQTRYHAAKATETEGNNLAASLFPELSRKLLIPVRGQGGEPNRMAFNEDPTVMADVISNLTQRGINPDQAIKAFRGGLAGQMAAAPVAGTSLPSANYQAFSGRVGQDFASTASSVFGIQDRDNMIANKEAAAMGRLTKSGEDALERANLSAKTSRANNADTIMGANSRAAAGIISRQEMNAQRLAAANAKLGANGQKPPPLNISIINQVEGTSVAGTDGLSSRDVDADYPATSKDYSEEKRTNLKNLYAEKFYEAYRLKNPPDAASAREAARNAVKSAVASGVMPVAAAATPADAVVATPGAAAAPGVVATTPAAPGAAPYAGAHSSPSQNMIDASDDQIAAGLGMSRDDLRALAAQQGISTKDYAIAVTTPAQEALPVEEEPGTPRTADTIPNYQESNVSAADALVAATAPATALPASPLDAPVAPASSPAAAVSAQGQYPVPQEQVPPASPEEMARLTAEQEAGPAAAVSGGKKGKGKGKKGKAAPVAQVAPTAAAGAPAQQPQGPAAAMLQSPTSGGLVANGPTFTPQFGNSQIQASSPMSFPLPPSIPSGIQPSLMDSVKSGFEVPSAVTPAQMVSFKGTTSGVGSLIPKTPYERQLHELTSMLDVIKRHPVKSEERDGFGEPTGKFTSAEDEFRIKQLEQRLEKLKNDPVAKVSPSAALLNNEFMTVPGLIVSGVNDVKEQHRDFVVTANEIRYLLGSYVKLPGKFPNTDYAYQDANNNFIDGVTVAEQFDKAHPKLVNLFIKEGRLGMKPGDSLGAKLVALHAAGNAEIMEASNKQNIVDFKGGIK